MASIVLPALSSGDGTFEVPGDKSISHRILMLSAIAQGNTLVDNCNAGEDVERTRRALTSLGVAINGSDRRLTVFGATELREPGSTIDCGNSGTTMRLLMGLLADRTRAVLDGDASLRQRPMERVASPLRAMGARIETSSLGRPPVTIEGASAGLRGIAHAMPFASAQTRSALLIAGLRAEGETSVSSPAVCRDHAERMLAAMGARVSVAGLNVTVSRSPLTAIPSYEVPGDISAAAFFLAGAAVAQPGGRLSVRRVGLNPTRTAALDVLRDMGLRIGVRNLLERHGEPVGDLDIICGVQPHKRELHLDSGVVPSCIDEIPMLCALAGVVLDRFTVRGASELRAKESDRVTSTAELLRAFGITAQELPDGIDVTGTRKLIAPERISTGGDHRIGMTAAFLALAARHAIVIDDAECIATSFPGFAQAWTGVFRG